MKKNNPSLIELYRRQSDALDGLSFSSPVCFMYNPLNYAWRSYQDYLMRYGKGAKRFLILGMNPGPFGMAQTGVPFGDVEMVRSYLRIEHPVNSPPKEHPKRPVRGFACQRREISGQRLWGWIKSRFANPDDFFSHALILNYCPLIFMEESGRNLTPDRLPVEQRRLLEERCDDDLRQVVHLVNPEWIIGMGQWTLKKARRALQDRADEFRFLALSHPSPASPKANKGWAALIESELMAEGIDCW